MSFLLTTNCSNVKALYKQIDEIAPYNVNVLLLGETGVGKEVIADLIQKKSVRSDKPYIKVNCTAIPETMIESELFGFEKGAFTGAFQSHKGKFEEANEGTILLDEIGDANLSVQAKILRVAENKAFSRLGSNKEIKCDVRIISATNKNIEEAAAREEFRSDLFYRLAGAVLLVPSLRHRQGDIENFISHFEQQAEEEIGKDILGLSLEAKNLLLSHTWPGNLREMQQVIRRAVIATPAGEEIRLEHITLRSQKRGSSIAPVMPIEINPLNKLKDLSLANAEKDLVLEALRRCNWQQNKAARLLGISPRAMNYKISMYGITHTTWKANK